MKTGEKVICIKQGTWNVIFGNATRQQNPVRDEIYEIEAVHENAGQLFVKLKGFRDYYLACHFRLLDYEFVDQLLKEVTLRTEPVGSVEGSHISILTTKIYNNELNKKDRDHR